MAWFLLFLNLGIAVSLSVCIPKTVPFVSQNEDNLAKEICGELAKAGKFEIEMVDVKDMWEGYLALNSDVCDAAVLDSRLSSSLPSSLPIFYDKALVIQADSRGARFSSLIWQYLLLLLITWLPIVIISAHVLHLIEYSELPISDYPRKILSSIYTVLTLQNLNSWPGRVYSLISCIFLFFLIVFIISDLAASMSSISVSSGDLEDKDVCMSQSSEDVWGYLYVRRYKDRIEECLDKVVDGDFEMGIVGKLEMAYSLYINDKSKYKNYLIYSETPHETQFSLVFSESPSSQYDIYQINLSIQALWDSGYILSSIQNYTTYIDIPSTYTSSFVFNSTRSILVGTTILVFFILAVLFSTAALILYRFNPRKSGQERELALSARALLRSRNLTLSLERSNHFDQQGHGRPEPEWVHKAVAVDDEHAQRIKNIQDYENELSAVAPVIPSFVSSESLLSILKLENKN